MAITVATATALRSVRATLPQTNTAATLLHINNPFPMIGADRQRCWRPVCCRAWKVASSALVISCPEVAFVPKSNVSHSIWERGLVFRP